jgi:murein DD-endopeptidase MepM/ murein hydrolase activator NlpD
MQIILLREKGGRARSHRLKTSAVALLAGVVLLGLVGNSYLAFSLWSGAGLGHDTVVAWRERIQSQRVEIESLKKQSREELDAVGRRLAVMQARLLRMEALGERVTEVANLDEGEFEFGTPPAVGGPEAAPEPGLHSGDLFFAMDELENHLRVREVELELLESMLATRKFHEDVALGGRPVDRGWMSSGFGRRVDPISGRMAWHAGVDFAGKPGSSVHSIAAGVVVFAGSRKGYGRMIEIDHGRGYVTRYGHHQELLVAVGDLVKKGQVIGRMGSTGRSTGPHVHLEMLKDGRQVDPSRHVARLAQGLAQS